MSTSIVTQLFMDLSLLWLMYDSCTCRMNQYLYCTVSTVTKKCLRKCLEQAFKLWEQVADVSFSEATIPPEDINIKSGQNI